MTGLGITGNLVAILVLLLVIGMTWLVLRRRATQAAATRRRKRADKGKVTCQKDDCKTKAGWVTPHGYFCEDHWEINARLVLADGSPSRVRWAHQLVWRKKGTDVWTT